MAEAATSGARPGVSDPGSAGPCLNFVRTGRCRFAACRFHHDEEARREALAAKRAAAVLPPSRSTTSANAAIGADAPPPVAGDAAGGPAREDGGQASGLLDEVPRSSWRSIDFLLHGESIKTHPYLMEFASAPWLQEMLDMKEYDSMLSVSGKRLKKELSEAFGVLHACRRALAKLGVHALDGTGFSRSHSGQDGAGPAMLVDLGCGKGFGSMVLAQSLPSADVLAVDNNPSMDLAHFRRRANLCFRELDITSSDAPAKLIHERGASGAPMVIVGMHLCGALSSHAIRIFEAAAAPAALVLAPCCLDGRRPAVKRKAKKLCIDPHRYWCLSLLMELPLGCRRELFVDHDVLSAKSTFLVATKME